MHNTKIRRLYKKLISIIILFALTSLVALFIPFIAKLSENVQSIAQIVLGAIFWLGLLGGLTILFSINKYRENYFAKHKIKDEGYQRLPGVFKFFQNKEAVFAEVALLFFGLLMIADSIFSFLSDWLNMVFLCVFIFSFLMHCVFESKNYKYIKLLKVGENNENK